MQKFLAIPEAFRCTRYRMLLKASSMSKYCDFGVNDLGVAHLCNNNNNIYVFRPNSSCGLWLFYILPLCIIVSALKLAPVSRQYYQMSVFAIQLLFAAYIFMKTFEKNILYKNKLLTLIGGVLFILGVRYIGKKIII